MSSRKTNRIAFAAHSDVGRIRTNNEDAFGAFPEAGVWCVADGMGGGDDGEVASAETVASVAAFAKDPDAHRAETSAAVAGVRAAVSSASQRIFDRSRQKGLSCSGSTFVCLVLGRESGSPAHALHAGDSRLYRIRKGVVRRITRDHSVAAAAEVRSERELNPLFRNMILRAVGIERDVSLDDTPFDFRSGDRVILCSDGLTRSVPDAELSSRTAGLSAAAAVQALIAAANAAGGEDNVTAIVVDLLPASRKGCWICALVLMLILSVLAWIGMRGKRTGVAPVDQISRAAAEMEREAAARLKAAQEADPD